MRIYITDKTYKRVSCEVIFQGCQEEGVIACKKYDDGYIIDFCNIDTDLDLKYTLLEEIFKKSTK